MDNEQRIRNWQAKRSNDAPDNETSRWPQASHFDSAGSDEGLDGVRGEIVEHRRKRRRLLVKRGLTLVGIPLLGILAYIFLVASPLHEGEAVFTVQTHENSASSPNAGFFAVPSANSTITDAFKARAFILSRPMMRHMQKNYGFLSHFSEGMDPLTRYGGIFGTGGDPLDYYLKRVQVTVDVQEGILRLHVQARTPEDAVRFGQGILKAAEEHVNSASRRIGDDQISELTAEVRQAEDALNQARSRFTSVKTRSGDLNPVQTAQGIYQLISELELQLAEAERQRSSLRSDGLVDSPLLPVLNTRIKELRAQIAENRRRLSQPGGRSLAQTVGEFDTANSRQEMALVRWQSSLETLQQAYLQILQQRRYFVLVVGMSAGNDAKVRDWLAISIPIIFIFLIGLGGVLAVRKLRSSAGAERNNQTIGFVGRWLPQ